AQKGHISETVCFGAFDGAENDGHTHFAPRASVGSKRRHVEITLFPMLSRASDLGRDQGRGEKGLRGTFTFRRKRRRRESSSMSKCDFDVTSFGANGGSRGKMSMPIVFSTIENPETHSFRNVTFLSCAR
ncbi:hypothetical protein PENTCL1PPCAC_9760, partial [Pristionchus entomophagus]